MNKQRREAMTKLHSEIEELQGKLNDIRDQIETLAGEEQEYLDAMPESLQGGEKGERAQEAISQLEDASGSVDEAVEQLNNVLSSLGDAGQ